MDGVLSILIGLTGGLASVGLILWIVFKERKKNKYSPFREKSLRSPGYSLGLQLDESISYFTEPLVGLMIIPMVYFLIIGQIETINAVIFAIPVVIIMVILGRQFVSRTAEPRRVRLGLEGEVYSGQELNFLMREGAYVYHDVPYKYGNIDHVVVSTGGVFVVETKAVRKPAGEDGKRQSKVICENGKLNFSRFTIDYPIRQAARHAEYMRKFLKTRTGEDVPVTAVVALPG